MYERYPGEANGKILRLHLYTFLHSGFVNQGHADLRDRLNRVGKD